MQLSTAADVLNLEAALMLIIAEGMFMRGFLRSVLTDIVFKPTYPEICLVNFIGYVLKLFTKEVVQSNFCSIRYGRKLMSFLLWNIIEPHYHIISSKMYYVT